MNLNNNSLISQSQQEEKAKYNVVITKITNIISIFDRLYGPSHHKKLIQTDINTMKLTSIASVILDNIKINHPLSKLLMEYVKKLDTFGDSSKYFLMIVKYLMEESLKIVEKGVKSTKISEIYREISVDIEEKLKDLVMELKISEIFRVNEKQLSDKANECEISDKSNENKNNLANENNDKTNESDISNKLSNLSLEDKKYKLLASLINNDKLVDLLCEAISKTMSFSTEKIRITKIPTGSLEDSYIIDGMIFEREPETAIKNLENATTAIYNAPLDIPRSELKSTILMNTAEELYNFSTDELKDIKSKVEKLNSDVIICSGKVNDIFLDFCNKYKKLVFKIMSKHDLRRIREVTGGYISPKLEELSKENQGFVKKIEVFSEGNKKYTKFIGNEIITMVLKNSLDVVLDEYERVINKALRCLSKNIRDDKIKVVDGSGIFENNLSKIFGKLYESENDLEMRYAYMSLCKVFKKFSEFDKKVYDIYNTKVKAIKYALDFVGVLYETEDYLIGVQEKLNIKPRMNDDWDEDH